jgi:predicted RNA methylase
MDFDEIVEMAVEITAGIVAFALVGLFFFMAFPVIGVMLAIVAGIGIVGLSIFAIVAAAVVAVDVCQRGLKVMQDLFYD